MSFEAFRVRIKGICPFFEYFLLMDDEPLMIYIIVIQCLRQTSVAVVAVVAVVFWAIQSSKILLYLYV